MLKMRSGFASCALVLVGLVAGTAFASENAPTVETISMFLKQQKIKTVEVTYASSRISADHKTDVSEGIVTYYVRTPEAVYLREEHPLLQGAPVSECSFDRNTGQYRLLGRATGMVPNGRVTNGLPLGALARQDLLDPIEVALFPDNNLTTVRLDQWVQKGTVYPTKEIVDGHECWRVDVLNPIEGVLKYQIWLDPAIGFCPRSFAIVRPPLTITVGFKDYREVTEGVWYPMTRAFGDPKGQYQMVTRVRSIRVGKPFSKDDLIVKFPSGTHVRDQVLDADYTVP